MKSHSRICLGSIVSSVYQGQTIEIDWDSPLPFWKGCEDEKWACGTDDEREANPPELPLKDLVKRCLKQPSQAHVERQTESQG